jgi:glyoxylase-like metal-dependent hydrolase (beta-lactamase superfamily II)
MKIESSLTDTSIQVALEENNIKHEVIGNALEKFELPSGRELVVATVDMPHPPYDPNLIFIIEDEITLIDAGPPMYSAFSDLIQAINLLDPQYEVYKRLKNIVITHAHFDHWGSLQSLVHHLMQYRSDPVSVYCHPYDRDAIMPTEASLYQSQKNRIDFHQYSGLGMAVPFQDHTHGIDSSLFQMKALEEGDRINAAQIIHLPGHTPGCIGVCMDNVVLPGDAILYKETPNTSSEILHEYSGLGHMLSSYYRLAQIGDRSPIAISGHGKVIANLRERALANLEFHSERLEHIYNTSVGEEMTGWEIADAYFAGNGRRLEGYSRHLGTVETMSHLEVGCKIGLFSVRIEGEGDSQVYRYTANEIDDVGEAISEGFERYRTSSAPSPLESNQGL